jgi:hypothetical protein
MRASVRNAFFDYTAGREGFTPFMYADTLNLVTTGVGNLIDAGARNGMDTSAQAMAPAMGLPWHHKAGGWSPKNPVTDGIRASESEIRAAWIQTKEAGMQAKGGFAYQNLTRLSLDIEGLKTLFNKTLNSFDASLSKHYPGYENWPADAQLAILSMSWAMGPAFHPVLGFAPFFEAVGREDFAAAAPASVFKGGGALEDPNKPPRDVKLISRNAAHQIMFANAANVVKAGGDRESLFFPIKGGIATPVAPAATPGGVLAPFGTALTNFKPNPRVTLGAAAGVAGAGLLGYGLFAWWKESKR